MWLTRSPAPISPMPLPTKSRSSSESASLGPHGAQIRARIGQRHTGDTIMPVGLKRDFSLLDDGSEAIASATRTLQFEAEGLSVLKAALANSLSKSFARAI